MAWRQTDQASELKGLIDRARAARDNARQLLQLAEQDRVAAEGAELAALTRAEAARSCATALDAEIRTLLEELAALVPQPRGPA